MKICPKCGFENTDESIYCKECGNNMNKKSSDPPTKKKHLTPIYLQPVFPALLFLIDVIFHIYIPSIIAIVLLVCYYINLKSINKFYTDIDNADTYSINTRAAADEYKTKIFNEAQKHYDDICEEALNTNNQLKEKIIDNENKIKAQKNELANLKKSIKSSQAELEKINKEITFTESDVYVDMNITSAEYKDKYSVIELKEKEIIDSGLAVEIFSNSTKSVINSNVKQIIRSFNSESASIIKSVTFKNIDTLRSKLIKSFEILNKIYKVDGVKLTDKFLEIKLSLLNVMYSYEVMKNNEKEEQKAIREQMLEEDKVRREIEKEKAKIEKEESQFKKEIDKLMKYMQKADSIEKQLYIDKIKELEEKLNLLEKDKANVLEREQNTRAGFVYIISNIGSFGENIYKIGMTRRLEPMDRIKELSSASVPFEFDVHAMIFSEDAPTLENTLHTYFNDKRVNKINTRKEFFNVTLPEIEKVVKEHHNATVTFTQIALAEQYRQSLKISAVNNN